MARTVRRAVAKKRTKAAQTSANRPKAPRTEAQLAAGRANIAKAQAAKAAKAERAEQAGAAPQSHPADENRPKAFFTFGERGEKREKSDEPKTEKPKGERPEPKGLTLDEVRNFREQMIALLVSLWELADKGLTLTALLDGEEAFIWRAIDDTDTAFLADRVLAKGRANPFVGAQVRAVIDHWQDARMTMILGPKLLESAGWYQARGLKLAFLGVEMPPKAQRQRRPRGSNGHQAGAPPTQPYTAEAYPYGAQ